jgi:hypothetical protein
MHRGSKQGICSIYICSGCYFVGIGQNTFFFERSMSVTTSFVSDGLWLVLCVCRNCRHCCCRCVYCMVAAAGITYEVLAAPLLFAKPASSTAYLFTASSSSSSCLLFLECFPDAAAAHGVLLPPPPKLLPLPPPPPPNSVTVEFQKLALACLSSALVAFCCASK